MLLRDCGARVWSCALGPDEGAHFHLRAQVCVLSLIQIFLLCVLSVITSRSVRSKGRALRFPIYCMSKPRVVRRAALHELRVLATTTNGPNFLEHVDQPKECWARNCSDTPWTVEDVPLLHIGAAGRAAPLQVAWERDIGAASSFAAIPLQLWGVRVRMPLWTFSSGT